MTSESMRVWRSGRSHLSLFLLTERERDLDALRARCLERERERERLFEPQNTQKQKRETDVDVQPSLKCTISKRNEEPRNSNRSLIWKYIPTSPQTCIKQCDDAIYSQKCNYSFEFQYHLHKQPSGGGVTGNLGVYCDHTHTHRSEVSVCSVLVIPGPADWCSGPPGRTSGPAHGGTRASDWGSGSGAARGRRPKRRKNTYTR